MALAKENPAITHQLEDLVSESTDPNNETDERLEGLVDLLVDLLSVERNEKPSFESFPSNNNSEAQVKVLAGVKTMLFLPPVRSERSVESPTCSPDSDNLVKRLEGLKPIRLLPPAREKTSVDPPTSDEDLGAFVTSVEDTVKTRLVQPQTPEDPASAPPNSEEEEDRVISYPTASFPDSRGAGEQGSRGAGETILHGVKNTIDAPRHDINPLEQLQQLMVGDALSDFRHQMTNLEQKVGKVEHQIGDPTELGNLMLPLIAEELNLKLAESKSEICQWFVPIIDEVIKNRTQQNKLAMSAAIADLIPAAISKQIRDYPEEVAKAIAPEIALAIKEQIRLDRDAIARVLAPEMGRTIKEQIRLERDAMVDALYPVIGNTITKYMAEAISSINQKIANAFSLEGVKRKIRAKLHGVSEAELIFKEAIPFTVQAIFLIHKGSGLVISDIQPSGNQRLESEMVAGMLTAIRSFVNDCIVQSGETSELDQIEYGASKIILEVAGYCYIAGVIKGEPPKQFIEKLRETLSTIILHYGKPIEFFDGDTATIPEPVQSLLEGLMDTKPRVLARKLPKALLSLGFAIASLMLIPWGIYQYENKIERRIEVDTANALESAPELSVYRLSVDAEGETLKLSGRVPNEYLRGKAEQIALGAAPTLQLDNGIIAVEVPPDPVQAAAEVKRVTSILNRMEGVTISAKYAEGKVMVSGTVAKVTDAQKIAQAFEQIPGVRSVTNVVEINTRGAKSK